MNFPCKIYDVQGLTVIGIAYNINDAITLLANNSGWSYMGTPYIGGVNSILWSPKGGSATSNIPAVKTNPNVTDSTVTGNTQVYQVNVTDIFSGGQVTNFQFPMNIYISSNGDANVSLGSFNSPTEIASAVQTYIASLVSPPTTAVTVTPANYETQLSFVIYNSLPTTPISIVLTTDVLSSQVVVYAGNTKQTALGAQAVYGIDLSNNKVMGILGAITNSSNGYLNQSIQVGDNLVIGDGSTGKIYVYNMTNPLQPRLVGFVQLNTVVMANFQGTPLYDSENWFWSLHFVSSLNNSNPNLVYVVESLTGTIWQVDVINMKLIGTAFQSNTLIGKKPQLICNDKLYFTQDGNLESGTGQSSGVGRGSIVILATTQTFNSGSLSTLAVTSNYVLAADVDYNGNIYFLDAIGAVTIVNAFTGTNIALGTIFPATASTFASLKINGNQLYASSQAWGTQTYNPNTGELVTFDDLDLPSGSSPNTSHYGFTVTNTDMGLLTFTNSTYGAGVAKYTLSGQFVGLVFGNFNFYNVIPFEKPKSSVNNLQIIY